MYYYRTDDRRSKVAGAVAALLYVALWVALMFLVRFSFSAGSQGGGMLIDFGDGDTPAASASAAAIPVPAADPGEEQVLTQDFEDAPAVAPTDSHRQPDARPQPESQPRPQSQPERQVNPLALFPGSGQAQGNATTDGGSQAGSGGTGTGTSGGGTGAGEGGTGFDLAGRNAVSLPVPDYGANKQGRVVVEITVDESGAVVAASQRAAGSTTIDRELVEAALAAARRSRFNAAEGAGRQTGTITYNFRLK